MQLPRKATVASRTAATLGSEGPAEPDPHPGLTASLETAATDDEILTPRQVAAVLQLGESTVYRALEAGRLPGEKICGRWRTLRSELIELVRGDRPEPTDRRSKSTSVDGRNGRFRAKVEQLGT
jgi:excisionase family DNA binding protein